jgi:hypothetical protein
LLEKAEAGKKRINFGIKPKLPEQQPVARQRQSGKPKAEPKEASTPAATEPNP